MTGLVIIWPVTMHLLAKLSICLGKANLARQSYCTLTMEKSLSWAKDNECPDNFQSSS